MAEKTTGTRNQDLKKNPHVNETPGGDGYDKREDVADNKRMESIDSGAESDAQPVPNRNQENLQNRGLQEDQPKNPVRSTGSLDPVQQEDKYRQPGDKFSEDADKISS